MVTGEKQTPRPFGDFKIVPQEVHMLPVTEKQSPAEPMLKATHKWRSIQNMFSYSKEKLWG
jgi:hypothetical protein